MEYFTAKRIFISRNIFLTIFLTILYQQIIIVNAALWSNYPTHEKCSNKPSLKYLSGDALTDDINCIGPNNSPYPSAAVARMFSNWNAGGTTRRGRQSRFPATLDPSVTQSALLRAYSEANEEGESHRRYGRSLNGASTSSSSSQSSSTSTSSSSSSGQCGGTPARLCKTRYNTTAPMYGVSLTSGQPVTIVQKFPDLLQQVVFEVCESSECDVVRGECTQTYVPYLFLVIPLGPVTLTGQDYVLVESGCVCKPKYSTGALQEPNIIP
ncbi:uncharacterized protein LOC129612754 [Condylostylus longicornis]|uniref:uncharacterized protein LOC129612754 n=1 Tax=Condylostylus longicornis TaxID=2530218 RepID=UPI00244DBD5C|nr:uncharacterized protein LOC129612754 [Condylostylus longicornis]